MAEDGLIGREVSHYRIDGLLGRGGMASVYFGWDTKLNRPAALKVMDARYRDEQGLARRFVQEARAVAALQHPNIVQIYASGEQDGLVFYAMEYLRGQDLRQLLARSTAAGQLLPYGEVIRIGRAAAEALDYAHRSGFVHRDVKPSNVMVTDDGRVMLTDFGLALNMSEGTQGEVFGSARYIAPEQAQNSALAGPQSDQYSLAVILYEMLTGQTPFDDPSPVTLAMLHMTQPPPPPLQINPSLSPGLDGVLLKALSKSPRARYSSSRALMDDVENAIRQAPDDTLPAAVVVGRPGGQKAEGAARPAKGARAGGGATEARAGPSRGTGPAAAGRDPLARVGVGCAVVVAITLLVVILEIILLL